MIVPHQRALVTGASRGIGEAFARQLAADEVDLVLAARSADRLDELATELTEQYGTACEVVPADLTVPADVERLAARLRTDTAPVDLLINNAGVGTSGPFADQDLDGQLDLVRLLVTAPTSLTRVAAEAMVRRGHGAIVNVSSITSYAPGPNAAVYAASKVFVRSFTEALHEELSGTGVRTLAVAPGLTRTAIFDESGADLSQVPGALWTTPEEVAATALRDLGRPRATSIAGLHNVGWSAIAARLPRGVTRRLAGLVGRRVR